MFIVDLTNPIVILPILLVSVLFIVIGKKFKISVLPLIGLISVLAVFVLNVIVWLLLSANDGYLEPIILRSSIYNLFLIFLNFIGYLWVDDIEAKFKNKKSIDNSMDWFWNNI